MDRLERLVNLVAALIDAERPLSRREIRERVGGYSEDPAAFRRNFERDKELLRQMGIPVQTEVLDSDYAEDQAGYRIPRELYELPDPGLAEDELAALRLAASAVQVEAAAGREATTAALRKLAAPLGEAFPGAPGLQPPAHGVAELGAEEAVATAFGAIAEQRRLRFPYGGSERLVDPWRLCYRGGRWYLTGWDHLREGERIYRLDRVEGTLEAVEPPGAFSRPPAAAAGPPPPWLLGEGPRVTARLLVDADQATWAESQLGPGAVEERRPDGSVVFTLPVINPGAFRSFVLGFLDHAEVLSPPELVEELVSWLEQVAAMPTDGRAGKQGAVAAPTPRGGSRPGRGAVCPAPAAAPTTAPAGPAPRPARIVSAEAPRRSHPAGRPGSKERLARILAIVPWIAARDGPRVEEVCKRFGIEEKDLISDLELLFLCGVHPFTPDTLIEVDLAGGRVWVRFAEWFRRPLRLTPAEGLALVAAANAFLATPGADRQGALARGLSKLETVLGCGADEVEVDLGPVAPGVLESLQVAHKHGHKVEIDYYSFGRDGRSRRVVHPLKIFSAGGQWYLSAWCERAAGERLFRVDRMSSARDLGVPFERPPEEPALPPALFMARPEDPLVVLDLDPEAHWVAERYPNEGVEARGGGVLRVALRVGERGWWERVLLRAGPHARIVEGNGAAGPAAAKRLLRRYRAATAGPGGAAGPPRSEEGHLAGAPGDRQSIEGAAAAPARSQGTRRSASAKAARRSRKPGRR